MPIGSASAQVRITAAIETTIVRASRSPMTSVTGRPHSIAMPKLPRMARVTHLKYWT